MLSKNNSYFDRELCLDGHYIVTGYTNDRFCNDLLQLTDIRAELHRYLRYEQDFQAVFFLDASNMLYCYDNTSFDILCNGYSGATVVNTSAGGTAEGVQPPAEGGEIERQILSDSPLGRRRRRRTQNAVGSTAAPAPAEREETAQNNYTGPLHMGRMHLETAWQQLISLLKNPNLRCALVLNNINSLQHSMQIQELQLLEELSSYHNRNHSIVIYLFKDTSSVANILDSGSRGSGPWATFAETVLFPRIETEDATANRVISLRTPNRGEISNLLNHLRFRDENPLRIRAADIKKLAELFAASCARNRFSLAALLVRLEAYAQEHEEELSLQNWREFMGDRSYCSPMEQLERLVGLEQFKENIRSWYALKMREKSEETPAACVSSRFAPMVQHKKQKGHSLNIILKGNPGTGKTTVARLMGQLYYELGLLPQGQLIECSASDLVSPNVGGTARLVRERVQEAMGGVLFIDEAYSLATDAHGIEAINQLVSDMSTYEGSFAVILAGYPYEMNEFMRQNNEGLFRRFPTEYLLPDYSAGEMEEIFRRMMANDPAGFTLSAELEERLPDFFEAWVGGRTRGWGNAGEAETLLTEMKKLCSMRAMAENGGENQTEFTLDDIPERLAHCLAPRSRNLEEAFAEIDKMIGLTAVKDFLKTLSRNILWETEEKAPGNYIFSGPPGTGKTTVARKMGEIFGHLGVLRRKTNNVVECRAADLLTGARLLRDAVEEARGGILFIDEAHQLEQSEHGHAIIRELVPLLEDPEIRMDTCFICAGYDVEMKRFLEVDAGLSRRFPLNHRIRFSDYSAEELLQILHAMASEKGEVLDRGYLTRTLVAFEKYMETRPQNFGNGGFIRDVYLPDSISARTARLNREVTGTNNKIIVKSDIERFTHEQRHTLTAADIPAMFARLAGPIGKKPLGASGLFARVAELVGKQEIKDYIKSLGNEDDGTTFFDSKDNVGYHYTITGPMGSGRHTAVRAIASAMKHHGKLGRDDVRFAGKADLEAGYVGQTAIKTQNLIEHAIGGTLVIEYPSALLPKNEHDISYGPDALGVIAGAMSAHMDDLCIVFLDSEDGLKEFFKAYPSFSSKFSCRFSLEDLSADDMRKIFEMKTRDNLIMDESVEPILNDFFINWVGDRGALGESVRAWGNGLEVERLIDDLVQNWQIKNGRTRTDVVSGEQTHNASETFLRKLSGDVAEKSEYRVTRRVITSEMFPQKYARYLKKSDVVAEMALSRLENMTGLHGVKTSIRKIERKLRRMPEANIYPGCYCYLGNPGVGKTTVAKLMGGVLRSAGVLSQGHVISRTARQMCDSVDEFDDIIKLAKNGILFIDEAHQLAEPGNMRGNSVIKRLLTVVEDADVMKNVCIILAGYTMDMLHMLRADSGLASRFGTEDSLIYFDDYSPEELFAILEEMAQKANEIRQIGCSYPLRMDDGYRTSTLAVFREVCAAGDPNFGNARFVRNYLHDSLDELLLRLDREYGKVDAPPSDETDLLTEKDIPRKYKKIAKKERKIIDVAAKELSFACGTEISNINYDNICKSLSESVVFLETYNGGQKMGEGSGSIITKSGHILTCAHVIRGAERFRARVYCPGTVGGDYRWFECTLLSPAFEDCDMAVLKMDGDNFKPVSMRPPEMNVSSSERTLILGYPFGSQLAGSDTDSLLISNFSGRIASVQNFGGLRRFYIDSTGHHGNSGSPVFSYEDCRMIGVFTGSLRPGDKENLDEFNYFYPVACFIERLLTLGAVREF